MCNDVGRGAMDGSGVSIGTWGAHVKEDSHREPHSPGGNRPKDVIKMWCKMWGYEIIRKIYRLISTA
jgi:hypothetical protein